MQKCGGKRQKRLCNVEYFAMKLLSNDRIVCDSRANLKINFSRQSAQPSLCSVSLTCYKERCLATKFYHKGCELSPGHYNHVGSTWGVHLPIPEKKEKKRNYENIRFAQFLFYLVTFIAFISIANFFFSSNRKILLLCKEYNNMCRHVWNQKKQ